MKRMDRWVQLGEPRYKSWSTGCRCWDRRFIEPGMFAKQRCLYGEVGLAELHRRRSTLELEMIRWWF